MEFMEYLNKDVKKTDAFCTYVGGRAVLIPTSSNLPITMYKLYEIIDDLTE